MITCSPISMGVKNVVRMSWHAQGLMSSKFCGVSSRRPSSFCCFHTCPGYSKPKCTDMSVSKTLSFPSIIGVETFQGKCFGPGFSKHTGNLCPSTVTSLVCSRGVQKRCLKISVACQNVNVRLMVPKKRMLRKITCSVGHWPEGCASAGLIFALFVCSSCSKPVHAEAPNKEGSYDSSEDRFSHGKKVYTDYSVTGIPGDGRCLFRSVAHGACLRSGKLAPNESLQREIADELRDRVADEFIKRRQETEWFIEGDFDRYVSQIRNPHVWGGEPELLMASHVLQMPITVYMHDKDSGGLIAIAEYGEEYGKENPIRVLYHGYGHYEALQIPGKKAGKSRF